MLLGPWLLACQSPSAALALFCDAEEASGAADLPVIQRPRRMGEYLDSRLKNEEAKALLAEIARAQDKIGTLERGLAAHGVPECKALDDMKAAEAAENEGVRVRLEAWCTLPEWCPGCAYDLRPDARVVERLGNPDIAREAGREARDLAGTVARALEIGVSPCPLDKVLKRDAAIASKVAVTLPAPEHPVKRIDDEHVRVDVLVYNPTPHAVGALTVELAAGDVSVSFVVTEPIPSHQHRWLVERWPRVYPADTRGTGLPLAVGPGDVPEVTVRVQGLTR